MAKELERRGLPVVLISAIPVIPLGAGANRVVKGVRVEHVCGDPGLSDAADKALRRRIVVTALRALQTPVDGPTLFEPATAETTEPHHAA
jgi:glycine reductase